MIEPPRRKFLTGAAALFCAPAIVRADSLMKVRVPEAVHIGYDIIRESVEPINPLMKWHLESCEQAMFFGNPQVTKKWMDAISSKWISAQTIGPKAEIEAAYRHVMHKELYA